MLIYNINQNFNLINKDYIKIFFTEKNKKEIFISDSLNFYLNKAKNNIELNIEKWEYYKKVTNPYEFIHTQIYHDKRSISKYNAISRSFYKLIEIVNFYNLLQNYNFCSLKSFHLAEGPGGFIEAMQYLRNSSKYYEDDIFYGMTLLKNDKYIPNWNKIKNKFAYKNNIIYEKGLSNDGDLLNINNYKDIFKKYKNSINLVTGDGGVDFSLNYEEQENTSIKLILAQIIYALTIQKKNGNFVLKIFDIFKKSTCELIFLLNCFYDNISISKPNTSRFGNSEKYIICKNFLYQDTSEFFPVFLNIFEEIEKNPSKNILSLLSFDLPTKFIEEIEELNCIFGKKQLQTIHNTLLMVEEKVDKLKNINIDKCIQWCEKNNIPYNILSKNNNIFTKKNINIS